MKTGWLSALVAHLAVKPIAILRIDAEDWAALHNSRRGVGEFTTAISHRAFEHLEAPTLCLLLADTEDGSRMMAGVIGKPSAVTTLQSRIKLRRVFPIEPASPDALVKILSNPVHITAMLSRLADRAELTMLSPKLSGHIIEQLAAIESNNVALRSIGAALSAPRRVRSNSALQDQGLRTALRAFGLSPDAPADFVELLGEDETAISRISVIEDGFIEHDARWIRGMDMIASDATGRAVFSRGNERLEVYTANRRQLEHALGVDLVYLNITRHNIVMVQYKMLEPSGSGWAYRPDGQLAEELERMRAFARPGSSSPAEYRLNPGVFYLKFVKRGGSIRQGGILMPLDHFQSFIETPASRGPRGGLRIDYDALEGRYLREQPFVDLIRAGYIGAYANDTLQLQTIVEAIIARGGAVVAAIQTAAAEQTRFSDDD